MLRKKEKAQPDTDQTVGRLISTFRRVAGARNYS
jgi:hypothetical protein